MNPRNKVFIVLLAALAVMVIIACSCSDISLPNGNDPEAIPGLAGSWQDPETSDVFVIAWQNSKYVVTSVTWEGTSYDITSQSWDGSSLTWSYYIPESDVSLSYQTTSLSGDSLYTNWWNDAGGSGTETLGRVR